MSGHHTRLRWCSQQRCFSRELKQDVRSWLFDSGSLTARLIEYCDAPFTVKLLSVKRATPSPDEIKALKLNPRSYGLIREVLLMCGERPVVYARTIIPLSSMRSSLRGVVLLGNKSLGAVLFADKKMRRYPMEITRITAKHKCYGWTGYKGEEHIWGRRSVFVLKDQPLLVSEFYLPALLKIKTAS